MKARKEKCYDVYEVIAKIIKFYRTSKKLTQAVLAEKTEYSHEFIRRIEAPNTQKNFSIDAVSNIANALDIDIELLFEKNDKVIDERIKN